MPNTMHPLPPVSSVEVPGYPAHYATRHLLSDGGSRYAMVSGDSLEDLIARTGPWIESCRDPRILVETIAPDGLPVTTQRWAGGTWGGRCGSSVWVLGEHTDPSRIETFRIMNALHPQNTTREEILGLDRISHDDGHTAAWWVNGIAARHGLDGFRASCPQPFRHDADCRNGRYTWTLTAGITTIDPYA